MNNVEIKNICKNYKDFSLKDINFDIPKGAIVGLIGENGAGKTTTIKAILNLINIDSGSIKIFNKDYKDRIIKENIGVVLSDGYFSYELNVKEINKVLKNIYKNYSEDLFFKYISKFNLPTDKNIKDFSTGMLMKLKIISAISHNPKLLILDEATSGLDPIARHEILDLLREFIQNEENSVLLSSHITSDLEHIADYIIFIKDGRVVLNKNHDELLDNYGLVKCTKEEFEKIKKEDYLKYIKHKYGYDLLIESKVKFKKKYNIKTIEKITLDDVMLMMIKGE